MVVPNPLIGWGCLGDPHQFGLVRFVTRQVFNLSGERHARADSCAVSSPPAPALLVGLAVLDQHAQPQRWSAARGRRSCGDRRWRRRGDRSCWPYGGQSVGCHLNNAKREHLRTMPFPTKEYRTAARSMIYVAASCSGLSVFPSDSNGVRLPVSVGGSRTLSGLTAERPFAGQPLGRRCSIEVLT